MIALGRDLPEPRGPYWRANRSELLATLAQAIGDDEAAEARWREALEHLAPTSFGYKQNVLRVRAAPFFISRGDVRTARELLEAARAYYHDPLMWRRRARVDVLLAQCEVARA